MPKAKLIETVEPQQLAAYLNAGAQIKNWQEFQRLVKSAVPAAYVSVREADVTFDAKNSPENVQVVFRRNGNNQTVDNDGDNMKVRPYLVSDLQGILQSARKKIADAKKQAEEESDE